MEQKFDERKKDWNLTGRLVEIMRRYMFELTNEELKEINLERTSGMPEADIIAGLRLPLDAMKQNRELFKRTHNFADEIPEIVILQGTINIENNKTLSAGDKFSLKDGEDFLINQKGEVLKLEIQYFFNGSLQKHDVSINQSIVPVASTVADNIVNNTPSSLSKYLSQHRQIIYSEIAAKNLLTNKKKINFANALFLYAKEARKCLNTGKQLPKKPDVKDFLDTIETNKKEQSENKPETSTIAQAKKTEKVIVSDFNSSVENSVPLTNDKENVAQQSVTESPSESSDAAPKVMIPPADQEIKETIQNEDKIHLQPNAENIPENSASISESPETEHQQTKTEDLLDISRPLLDQEPFQEVMQELLKNNMSQAANILHYLGSYLDESQEKYQNMQIEFQDLKKQMDSIEKRFFNDTDSIENVQNNLQQSEKFIMLNKSRLANVVLQTKSRMKTAGKNVLLSFAEKIHVPGMLISLQQKMQHTRDSLDILFQRLNDAKKAIQDVSQAMYDVSNSVKNVGRALTGKELLEYVPWDPEKGKIASIQHKIYNMERTIGNLQEKTNALLLKMQGPEQKPKKQTKKTTQKAI